MRKEESSDDRLIHLLEILTGERWIQPIAVPDNISQLFNRDCGIGYSQFNEVLLMLGYDRISQTFFQFLIDGTADYTSGNIISSTSHLEQGVNRFVVAALNVFGNLKFAFKTLSAKDTTSLRGYLSRVEPESDSIYRRRHPPAVQLEEIPAEDSYYQGYLIERDIRKRLEQTPNDEEAVKEEKKRQEIVKRGKKNFAAYLASDHMDVYIATSMRERHEYVLVNEISKKIFGHPILRDLNLRWFDPTQAYCSQRIDKGLSEALMLKRAKCTVYLIQENDTLGKDSELASTLAQGKPVIAFVPEIDEGYIDAYLNRLSVVYPEKSDIEIILEQLRLINPSAAWGSSPDESEIRTWLDSKAMADIKKARAILKAMMKVKFDGRARLLQEDHPLGIQVTLESGVANGVLVARSIEQCANIIYRILTRNLEFDVKYEEIDSNIYIFLREKISGSIFRVITGNQLLTNAFWNFYLN